MKKTIFLINYTILLWGIVEIMIGFAQLIGILSPLHRIFIVTGSFPNPGPFCAFIGCITPIATNLTLSRRSAMIVLPAWLYLGTSWFLMTIQMGRIGILAAICGSVMIWTSTTSKQPFKFFTKDRRSTVLIMLTFIFVCILLFLLKPSSAMGRIFIWLISTKTWIHNLFKGTGWCHVAGAIGEEQEKYFFSNPNSIFTEYAGSPEFAFNEYLQIAIAFGIIGLFLFISVIAFGVKTTMKAKYFGLYGTWISFAIVCIGSYPLQFQSFRVLLFILTGMSVVLYIHENRNTERSRSILSLLKYIISSFYLTVIIAIPSFLLTLQDYNDQNCTRYTIFERGLMLRNSKRYHESNEVMKEGLKISGDPMFLNIMGRNMEDIGNLKKAEKYYKKSATRLPIRIYPYYLLARMYSKSGCNDSLKFHHIYEKAMNLKLKAKSPATEEMVHELKLMHEGFR